MNETSTIRKEIAEDLKIESELSDLKQHADKMIRGFENFNNYSSNRAIWELVQNACDLTKNCEVVIDYRNKGFAFTHNGTPFTTKTFDSLIKQVSGKYGEESEITEVGKYGTGFLTTHTFGRKFIINSILEAKNLFFEIKDFLIDRSPKEWKKLSANIKTQKDNVLKIIDEGAIISNPEIKTTFTFIPETIQESSYIFESSKDLEDYIPIVLTINDRLKKVNIIFDNNIYTHFERISKEEVSNNLFKTTISKNEEKSVLYSIVDTKDQIEIILPINEKLELFQFPERVARLFLYYPLIGTEDFGLNFIINCNQFLPTEQRDGIHLNSNKDQVEEQEEKNRKIIEKASQLIFDFLKSNIIKVKNPLLYAQINFKRNTEDVSLNEYFEKLQNRWVEELKLLPFVETSEGFKSVNEACFFDEGLLNNSTECFDDIYKLTFIFHKNIPIKENVLLWSKFVGKWASESVSFINHEKLVIAISKENLFQFDKNCLINYYNSLITEGKTNFFSEHTLLPNLDGKFCSFSSLLSPKDLNETLIEIGKILIPHSIEKLIHKDFCFFDFEKFNRKNFSNNVRSNLDELQVSTCICLPESFDTKIYNELALNDIKKLEYNFFINLLKYCKLNNSVDSQSKPTTLIKIISRYYSFDDNLIPLSNLEIQEDNLDIRSARRIFVQVFFNLLQHHNSEWVKQNIPLLLEVANCNEDSLKEVFSSSKIYPNQLNQLKSNNELKRDIDVISEIKERYNRVTKDEIRECLVYQEFNEFITEDRFVNSKYLTNQIEDVFFDTNIHNINEHPFKVEILDIISKLKEEKYAELFPRLNDNKAKFVLDVVTNENTKNDIFSIVTLDESQLKKLGRLVQEDNFEAILNAASSLLQQQTENTANFWYKHKIGTYIESLIREKLSKELQNRVLFDKDRSIEATDVQGGQDIVVFLDGNQIYFIEVKSRWDSKNPVSMSKLQLQRAVEENERYALCAVNITHYTGSNDRYNLSTDEILPLTKFVTNIGNNIKPLIENNLEAEKNEEKLIHLKDYRGIVPQGVIKEGNDFQKFIKLLTEIINTTANIDNA